MPTPAPRCDTSTPAAYRYPVDNQPTHSKSQPETEIDTEKATATPKTTTVQPAVSTRPRVDLRVPPPPSSAQIMTGSRKPAVGGVASKLRFPLRSSSQKDSAGKEDRPMPSSRTSGVLNFTPTRSTLSSRNKENKATNEGENGHEPAAKTKSLSGVSKK